METPIKSIDSFNYLSSKITDLSEMEKKAIVGGGEGTYADEIGNLVGWLVNAIEDMDAKNTYPNSMMG